MNKKNLVLVVFALCGCTVMNTHERVPGWPELKVVEHHVAHAEVRNRCQRYTPPLSLPLGCTIFNLNVSEAHIYVSKDFPAQWVLEHERLHAAGYDHVGSTNMLRLLEDWNAAKVD